MSSSRLYIAVLVAAVAAFFLVPVAQAGATATLKQNIKGNGGGKVTSVGGIGAVPEFEEFGNLWHGEPPIECTYASPGPATGVCEDEVPIEEGFQAITLRAIPSPGSEFAGWALKNVGNEPLGPELDCSSAPNCLATVSPGPEREATAVFCTTGTAQGWGEACASVTPKFALTIAKTGEGTVTSSPAGIECTGAKTGAECTAEFESAKVVTLTASPATGYALGTWAGCTEHVGLTCKVLMDKAKTIKVGFIATPTLTVEKAGTGQGKASATGIGCDENCSKATSAIKTGTLVTVKTISAKGSEPAVFEGGTGSASGCSGESCTFTISANSSVKVKFVPKPTKTLTINLTGPAKYKGKVTGKGTIKGLTGSAINCGSGCTTQTESFFAGDTVTLTAVAGTGYTFAGWSGSEAGTCTGTTSPCTISTSANKTLSAEFK